MSELQQAINEMRNMRESYDQLGAAAEAYNTGKGELAQNITSKGVQASATETLPELAEKVAAISQESYTIQGGEMYAKQLFGSLETPNYWNLYEVLMQLLSDGRLVQYGGILLAEYYRGYDSLALAGAGAGGAYVVSDKDENGQFKMYTEDTTHTWDTEFDGKCNRWVAYCFADEYHDFQITDTNTSPRSIFIGRKVGTITSLVAGRVSQIVVPDGSELISFNSEGHTQNFGKSIVLKTKTITGNSPLGLTQSTECGYIKCENMFVGRLVQFGGTWIIEADTIEHQSVNGIFYSNAVAFALLKANKISGMVDRSAQFNGAFIAEEVTTYQGYKTFFGQIGSLYLGYISNDKTKLVYISAGQNLTTRKLYIQDGWCKPLHIAIFTSLTKEDVQANIFDRLGVNDLSTGAVRITLANAVLNLFTQEEIDAVVARTNITIVGA